LAIGVFWGILNGWLVTKWNLSSFLVTVAMLFLGMGFERAYSHGLSVWLSRDLRLIYKGFVLGVPNAIFFLIGLYIPFWLFSTQTRLGHHMKAIGENVEAAREVGIRTSAVKALAFSIAGGLYAAAGILETMRASGAIAYAGMDVMLPALGATFLGATMFRKGPNVLGTLVGSLLFGTITNAFTLLGAPFYLIPLIQGLLLVAAVSVSTLGDRRIRQVKF
ncbi:MAG: ABC transporter permease, partial [Chloroflexi bacterium]|nr:ABC transporter permease [Chloroflexota bacterium]